MCDIINVGCDLVIKENLNFTVECSNDLPYLKDVIDYLNSQTSMIMNFFAVDKLSRKIKVVVWNDIEEYRKHCEKHTSYKTWMCGDTFGGNINMLSIEECRKTKEHADMNIDEFKTIIAHEFVHICHGESVIHNIPDDYGWFWEALATNLGNPFSGLTKIDISKEELMNNFNDIYGGYQIAFSIGKYMLLNYPHELILKYIKYPKFLVEDTDKILQESSSWVESKIEENHKKLNIK